MRGPRLLDDDVRAELAAARGRGATVTVLDEGGLEDVDEASLDRIRAQLADDPERGAVRSALHQDLAP